MDNTAKVLFNLQLALAWEEGYKSGLQSTMVDDSAPDLRNPYRESLPAINIDKLLQDEVKK